MYLNNFNIIYDYFICIILYYLYIYIYIIDIKILILMKILFIIMKKLINFKSKLLFKIKFWYS